MKPSWKDTTIALAGVLQATTQVEQLAKTGYVNTEQFETAVGSLFATSPDTTIDVYGKLANIQSGLETFEDMLSNYRKASSSDAFRYALGVLHLQKRLSYKDDNLALIAQRLELAEKQAAHFGLTHDNVIRNIADIYAETISTYQYRIQVTGNYDYLQQNRVAGQVRTLLLAAIRSAMLWRQLGGSRWQFIMYRGKLLDQCRELIKQAKQESFTGAA